MSTPLDSVLKEYKRASEMPDKSAFVANFIGARVLDKNQMAKLAAEAEDAFIAQETGKLYKAMDSYDNVFLITNPATWTQDEHGVRHRPKPKAMGTLKELMGGGDGKPSRGRY